ncbi:MAG TPA: CDP-archaeol synthase, partial [Draconibacterium sp.]|nr:CDP-archaeol synthase [Draconibacterium sp.]
ELFGKNKTLRGFVFLPFAIGTVCLLESFLFGPFGINNLSDFLIGFGLGLAYILAELPNSYFKRRKGIAPGQSASGNRVLQLVIDKSDSLIGACIFYYFAMNTGINTILLLFVISFLLHISISYLLVIMKLKKSI